MNFMPLAELVTRSLHPLVYELRREVHKNKTKAVEHIRRSIYRFQDGGRKARQTKHGEVQLNSKNSAL